MPVVVDEQLPAFEILKSEGVEVGISPSNDDLRVGVLNIMPIKEDTETDLTRAFSRCKNRVLFEWLVPKNHKSKNTSAEHISRFYSTISTQIIDKLDALIITGAPVELIEYEDVDYWGEFCSIIDYARSKGLPVLLLCWAAFGALYHRFGINKMRLPEKLSGVFAHEICNVEHPLMKGVSAPIYAPQSRNVTVEKVSAEGLDVLSRSHESRIHIAAHANEIYITGHGEYNTLTLHNEYVRDCKKGLNPHKPKNYYSAAGNPQNVWQEQAQQLFENWVVSFVEPFALQKRAKDCR